MILEEFLNSLLPPVTQQTSESLTLFLAQSLQFGKEITDCVLGHISAPREGCSSEYLVLTHTSRSFPSPHWILT